MRYFPEFDSFSSLAVGHDMVPVCRRMMCDHLTPVSAFKKIDDGGVACLFESVVGGEKVGRYSFLASRPTMVLSATGTEVTVRDQDGRTIEVIRSDNPLDELRQRVNGIRVAPVAGLPPFAGGAVGYAAYDVVRYCEELPNAPEDDRNLPDLSFAFYDEMIVFDNVNKTMTVLAMAKPSADEELKKTYQDTCERVDQLIEKVNRATDFLPSLDIDATGHTDLDPESNFTQADFEAAVRKCVDYIEAGDIFQVVLSQRLKLKIHCDPFEIYRTLRVVNPSPFMFFLRTAETTLIGSSPEIMCRVVDRKVTVRPLAGTRPRGETEEEDLALEQELLADPKERAEHVMLVDLGRNDVGRVATFGTVQLPDVMVVERYSHVMHISSTVHGLLREELDAFDALAASLPAGTVSGAPKVRAMEIIDELEPHRRGPYAGAVGYLDYSGNMDTCIALRTLVVHDDTAYIQAGAGIVADSQPALEYQETLNKARGLLKAIEITENRMDHGAM